MDNSTPIWRIRPATPDDAEALARGETTPNRCPPGGETLIGRLASLLGVPATPEVRHTSAEGIRTGASRGALWVLEDAGALGHLGIERPETDRAVLAG